MSGNTEQDAENVVNKLLKKAKKEAMQETGPSRPTFQHLRQKYDCTKAENTRAKIDCTKEIVNPICKCGAIFKSKQYIDDMQLKKIKLAFKEQERNLQAERESKIKILIRRGDLGIAQEYHEEYSNFVENSLKKFDDYIEQTVNEGKQMVSCAAFNLQEVITPKFYDLFNKWCYAKHCEHFLNQMAPKEWRIDNDHIFYNQMKKSSDTENSSFVLSEPPFLEYVPYQTKIKEDLSLRHDTENTFNTFKRDLEMRGQYVPVPKPYFDTNCQLEKRLQKIENSYENELRTAMSGFVIGKKFNIHNNYA